MTHTGNETYNSGFLAGQLGFYIPPKADQEWLEAYADGYAVAEMESANAEYRDREMMK